MFKRILFSAGTGTTLLFAACTDSTDPRPDCTPMFNTVKETRGDTLVTTTGLRYIETQVGTGGPVVSCRGAAVSLRGTLLDNTEFQPSVGYRFTPGLHQLLAGFEQGVIGMRVGGTRRLIIPPELGYGSQDQKDSTGKVVIPANSTIVFDVGALAVEP
jgi:FKBP-type peptidyl-prolyl cis-trans isomerase